MPLVTEAATEVETLPEVEQTEPVVMPSVPAVMEETEAPTEPVQQPEKPGKPDKNSGILAYWPVAVAAIFFFVASSIGWSPK